MSINLLPWREQRRQKHKRQLRYAGVIGVVFVILATVLWQVRNGWISTQQFNNVYALQRDLKAIATDYARAVVMQQRQQAASKQRVFLTQKLSLDKRILYIMQHLSTDMPTDIYLSAIKRTDTLLLMTGRSPTHAQLAAWLQHMAQLMQAQPTITETAQAKDLVSAIDFSMGYEIDS